MKNARFINTLEGIGDLVDWADRLGTEKGDLEPPLYIDVEGERLGRDGHVSLLTALVYPGQGLGCVHIIDIYTLGSAAFHAVGTCGKSLKDILESPQILKAFFDVRNDSDALYSHFGIKLRGVWDIQLMESANRRNTRARRLVSGLSRWSRDMETRKGGSYSAFNTRPLSDEIMAYCASDVQYLPLLFRKYRLGTVRWRKLVAEASQNRILASQKAGFQPHGGMEKALSPWSAEQHKILDSWSESSASVHFRFPNLLIVRLSRPGASGPSHGPTKPKPRPNPKFHHSTETTCPLLFHPTSSTATSHSHSPAFQPQQNNLYSFHPPNPSPTMRPFTLLRQRTPLPSLFPSSIRLSSSFTPRAGPPKLPADQQAEFERLQRSAAVSSAFQDISSQTQTQTPLVTESPRHTTTPTATTAATTETTATTQASKADDKEELNTGLFRGAPPEFEGEANPKTGEVGGPKNEPLRWGGDGDWSYNGRVTDF
ncbi:Succinate dehydrogenase assembly factor 4 [Cladobotryum mycophilum]|uniref:Succinate dehydrogenase assembly factor 4 n=1 Tax=Cladobotryum mycophilum TaxID=491253 RepID=A0ABR0SAP2_9HYPO